jgi:hypothetical protein
MCAIAALMKAYTAKTEKALPFFNDRASNQNEQQYAKAL